MFALRWIANSSHLSNHAQSMRRRAETQILCTGSAGRQCKVQVVAALVIRDAVGDAISRQQAAVKPGPWPGRRAAGEALSRASSVLGGHVHGRTFTCPHLGSVYLYLRRSETGLPLPEAPHASPTSTCAPALRADGVPTWILPVACWWRRRAGRGGLMVGLPVPARSAAGTLARGR